MRFVIQRVMHSKVTINGEVRGQIGKGFMVLIAQEKKIPLKSQIK